MEPTITLTPRLKEYLDKKGLSALMVDVAECKSCGGAIAEVFARTAKQKELERLKQSPHRLFESEGIEILVTRKTVTVEAEVVFDLRTFLGIKDVTVKGMSFQQHTCLDGYA